MCNPLALARPDDVLASGEHANIQWQVIHNRMGHRCGYVRIPKGHPWHGIGYDDVEPYPDVHGGLTFAEPDEACDQPGEDDAWWLGFDCAHCGDAADPDLPGSHHEYSWPRMSCEEVRSQAYVEAECRSLCEQAAGLTQKAD